MKKLEISRLENTQNAQDIFYNFISKRIPFTFPADESKDCIISLNFNTFLSRINDKSTIKVENSASTDKIEISVKDFLESKQFYLNTQYSSTENNSLREIIQDPLLEFLEFFNIRPNILGNLVPRQYTLWMGFNESCQSENLLGSSTLKSSGLHHDFHDNLYIVLEGVKKFRIYSPKEIEKIYVKGKEQIFKVFSNGFVSYSPCFNRGDGASEEDVLKWKLQELESDLENSCENSKKEEIETEIERVLEKLLEISQDDSFSDSDSAADSDSEISFDNLQQNKKRKVSRYSATELNFSRIKDTSNQKIIEKEFPEFQNAKYYDIILRKGDGLFLPAGWFHEVWSFRSEDSEDSLGVHMAMNYWMAPPTQNDFDKPYEDWYWESKFKEFLKELQDFEKNSTSLDVGR